jgi:hypothetical protein
MAPSDDDMAHQNIEVLDFLNIGFVSFVLPIPFSAVSSTLQTHPKHSTITQLAFTNVLFITWRRHPSHAYHRAQERVCVDRARISVFPS